ncbi:MAG: efflux RND transporter periplasmic adaptor subunit, partial [Proteobacteria bacterium]|nr:efflux RND transporter periplasmic adaptor subunit [Pseudomonadota bacterium]
NGSLVTAVETKLINRNDITRYHEIPAIFLAENRADLSFQLSGTINQSLVKIGEEVEPNQILMSLYNPSLNPALNTNMARLESVKAQIAQAQRDVARLAKLRKNNSVSKTALELQETSLKDLVAQEKSVQAQISLALANQSEATIKAPFASTIATVDRQTGEFVQAGQVVMSLYQQDMLEVEINITAKLWQSINLGDNIAGKYNHATIEFEVVELAQMADARSRLMKVILRLNSNIDNAIGQQVILLLPQTYQAVYQLPLEAIVDDGINKPYVFTMVNDMAVKHHIQPLFIENGQIIFWSDVDIQNPVVIKGQSRISVGTKLQARLRTKLQALP